jgi:hypothetical protein
LANTWTLIQLPNIPIWIPAGNWTCAAGSVGYTLGIYLAAGSNFTPPANDTWQNGNLFGAIGAGNFLATVGATFDIAYLGHEPGPLCTLPIDSPFSVNYEDCLRYFSTNLDYGTALGGASNAATNIMNCFGITTAYGFVPFPRPMATHPSIAIYNHATGGLNTIRGTQGIDRTVTSAFNIGQKGFAALGVSPAPSGTDILFVNYAADTSL